MDVQLKELLEKINKDGIQTAEQKASEIVEAAEKRAESIIADAQKKAAKTAADAKAEAARAEAGGKAAIAQAGRDLVLKTKSEIEDLFRNIVDNEVKTSMTGKTLENAVMTIVKSWAEKGEYTVQLSEKDFNELGDGLKAKLAQELKKGFEIKPFSGIDSGFRLSEKDGGAYYNFTSEAVSSNLAQLLNPKLSDIVNKAAKE